MLVDFNEEFATGDVDSTWTCRVCGQINHEYNGKMQRLCITCGRQKGYAGSKRIQVLGQCRVDVTPHLTSATKDELRKAEQIKMTRLTPKYDGNKLMFLSKKNDYEAIARMDIRGEVSCVIASIRNSLEAKSNGA
jgi:predicted  nucleic acid-binding Zn-ribbon protein